MTDITQMLTDAGMPKLANLYDSIKSSSREFAQVASNSFNPDGYIDIHKSIHEIQAAMAGEGILPPETSWFSFSGMRWNEAADKAEPVKPLMYIELMLPILASLSSETREDLERIAESFGAIGQIDLANCRDVDLSI